MRARIVLLLTVAATVILGVIIFGGPGSNSASAALSSCGTKFYYLDTAQATGLTQIGARAQIDTVYPALCDSGGGGYPSYSGAWSMEYGAARCDGWAQAGYEHDGAAGPNGGYQWSAFTQYTQQAPLSGCSPNVQTKFYGITPGGNPSYKVDLSGTLYTYFFQMWVGSTFLADTNFNPYGWTGNWIPEFAGETDYCESDVPGTAAGPVAFRSVQKEATNNTWSSTSDLALSNPDCPNCYHIAWLTQPSSFIIWTDPLN
jgi:hypothetical protein